MYKIKVYYIVGNDTHQIDRLIYVTDMSGRDLSWNNIKTAQENLETVYKHYDWCKIADPSYVDQLEFVTLKTDDNKCIDIQCLWIGYFETLIYAKIEYHDDNNQS